jgi:uncharacterized protein involved in exopolysaccharide biosynthesis
MVTKIPLPDATQQEYASPALRANGKTASESDEISLLDIAIILAERKGLILKVTLVFVILATIISFVLPKRYTATVTLLTPQQNSSLSAALSSQLGSLSGVAALAGGGLGLKNPNDIYVAMLKSRTTEDAMVQRYELMREYREKYPSDARKAFERRSTVDGEGKDGLIRISIRDRDPKRAAELANGYVDQFRKLSEHLAITEASQRRLFFEQQLAQAKENLANAEEALKKTEQQTGMIQLDAQARALIESAATLRAQIAAKEVQIQAMQNYATRENTELVQAQTELQSLHAQLAKLGGTADGAGDQIIVPRGRVTEAGLEYVRKLRDVKYYDTIFEILARQFELAKLDEAKQGAVIQVVDPAIPPDKRSFPKRVLIIAGAAIAGLFIGICLALFLHGLQHLKSDPATDAKLHYLKRVILKRGIFRTESKVI